jgi:hypothetical protein
MISDCEEEIYCPRCNGVLRREISYHQGNACEGLSCVKCGEWIDDIILENREESLERIMLKSNNRSRLLYGSKLSGGKASFRHDEILYYFKREKVKKADGLINQSTKQ